MKIVFIINSLEGGGAERVISTLTSYFVNEKKHHVSIITLHKANCFYNMPPSVKIVNLKSGFLCVGPGKILLLPLLAMELSLRLKSLRPDAVISLLVRSNLAHLMTRWFGNRSKIVISERCNTEAVYPDTSLGNKVMKTLIKLLYPKADRIISISEGVKQSLVQLGVPAKHNFAIHNPQNLEAILKKSRKSLKNKTNKDAFTVITIGRLVDQKDHKTLLKAHKIIREALNVQLVIMGEGPLETSLKEYAAELEIADSVSWIGWQDNPFESMAKADLFVLSSKYEGFGNVIIEAMACGLPVVSTDCPSGPGEILMNGEYGALVPVGDSEGIARAVIKLLQDRALYNALQEKGFKRADDFDVKAIAQKYLDVLCP